MIYVCILYNDAYSINVCIVPIWIYGTMPYDLLIMILFQIIHNWQTGYFLTKQCGFKVLLRLLVFIGTYSLLLMAVNVITTFDHSQFSLL